MHIQGETPVLIIGAGPAGLTTAIALGRLGTPCVLVERRATVGSHPRATGVRTRTMEVFRGWGLEPEIRRNSLPTHQGEGVFTWVHTVAGEQLGHLSVRTDEKSIAFHQSVSPTAIAWCAQDVLEPILADLVSRYPAIELRTSTQVDDLALTETGATATLHDLITGEKTRIAARFMVAADGAGSGVRSALGIELDGPDNGVEFININFRADLGSVVGERPAIIHWVINSRSSGGLITVDGRNRWLFTALQPIDHELADDWCVQLVRDAVGIPDLPVEIVNAKPFRMTSQVAKMFRTGNVFLVGDAAHRFPPTGGFGMNSSIQDAHNLAWKLHAVHTGWAGAGLLDSYEAERKPIAEFNSAQSWRNLALMAETGFGPAAYEFGAALEGEAGQEARAQVRRGIPRQMAQFDALGQDLGFGYEAGALIPDGSESPTPAAQLERFVPVAGPGFRHPHHVLVRAGKEISTLDLFDDAVVLLSLSQEWVTGAISAAAARGVPLRAYRIGEDLADPTGSWPELAGVGTAGACLVRPDGHVMWRTTAAGDAGQVIGEVLDQVLSRS
jgi:putative polyketide hydroxylase